jgi:ComF family protein
VAAERLLDLLLPPVCAACEQPVTRHGLVCARCFQGLNFITDPCCARCGVPFEAEATAGRCGICPACEAEPPAFRQARAAFRYDAGVRRLLLAFKHGDQPSLADVFAPHLVRAGSVMLRATPLLVPVPLHRRRLFRRRYNQAALLAQAVGALTGAPVLPDGLRRRRATPSLDDRGPAERRAIMAGAVEVRPRRAAALAGREVILIDDVMTSGATASACTEVLLRAGARSVDVLVVARVPLPGAGGPAMATPDGARDPCRRRGAQ